MWLACRNPFQFYTLNVIIMMMMIIVIKADTSRMELSSSFFREVVNGWKGWWVLGVIRCRYGELELLGGAYCFRAYCFAEFAFLGSRLGIKNYSHATFLNYLTWKWSLQPAFVPIDRIVIKLLALSILGLSLNWIGDLANPTH